MATPFDGTGAVDFAALGRLVERVIEGGADYIVALGTTAETPTLDHDERAAVAAAIREKAAKRVRLMLGMGGNDTAKLCAELRALDPRGWDAILTVAPYYNKPSQEGLYQHYRAVAEAAPLPVMMYNIPGRTGVNMTAETTLRIAREVPNITGVKEASGNIDQIARVLDGAPDGFAVVSGDDAMTLDVVARGGAGVISVMANAFPERMRRVARGEREAWEGQLAAICPLLFAEGSPVGLKALLAELGVCGDDVRLPLVAASPALRNLLSEELRVKS